MNLAVASVDAFWSELDKIARVPSAIKQYRRAMQMAREGTHHFHGTGPNLPGVARSGSLKASKDLQGDTAVSFSPRVLSDYWKQRAGVIKRRAGVQTKTTDFPSKEGYKAHGDVPLGRGDYVVTGAGTPAESLRAARELQRKHRLRPMDARVLREGRGAAQYGSDRDEPVADVKKRLIRRYRRAKKRQAREMGKISSVLEKIAEKSGHWRKLKPGQVGEGPYGAKSPGRTWVDTKPRKKKQKGRPKKGEFAPGIPKAKAIHSIRPIKKPTQMRFVVQHHPAVRAGDHHDIRLGDPVTGHAHSWATKKDLPKPGDRPIRVYQQPTHTYDYLDFKGHLHGKYGRTKKSSKGVQPVVDQRTEVLQADDNFVRFNTYKGREVNEYILTRRKGHTGKGATWFLINVTKTKERMPKDLPFSKPKYREVKPGAIDLTDDTQVMAAKLDGGHVTTVLKAGQRPRTYSYRRPKERKTGVIEHSQKVRSLYHTTVPKELGNTILRGELYARDRTTKKPLAAETVGGMLNAGVWKSRRMQDEHGELRSAIFDVVKFRGKDMSNASYQEKLEALRSVKKAMPQFEIPDMAFTQEEKKALLSSIKEKKHPATHEGVILWNAHKADRPTKAKFKADHDVYIRKVEQAVSKTGSKKAEAGALWYSLTSDGPIVGKVGTGFSRALRQDIWKRPHTYIGAVAKVRAQTQYKSGALGKPAFTGWHIDKSPETFWARNPVTK